MKVSFSGIRRLVRNEEADKPQAGAIIIKGHGDDRRILLVTNKEGKRWLFPKGTVKKKEFSEEAAEREAAEESGVCGEVIAYVGSTEFEEDDEQIRVDYFLLYAVGETEREEDRRRRWVKPDEVMELIDTPQIRALLKHALPEIASFQVEIEQ